MSLGHTGAPTRPPLSAARAYLLSLVVMAAMVTMFFNPVVLRNQTFSTVDNVQQWSYPWLGPVPEVPVFLQLDQAVYVHPRQVFLDRALKVDEQIPLWNPMTFGGHPFLAEAGSRLGYPPLVLLSLLSDPVWMHDLYVVMHVFAAGMAMFAFMRELRAGAGGALLAGVAWAFSSYTLGAIMLEMFAAPAALLPLVLLCLRRWHDRRSVPALLTGTLLLGLLFLGTSMELALLSFLCAGGYASSLATGRVMAEWRERTHPRRLAPLAAPAVLVLGAVAIGAVALTPFLELASRSERVARSPLTWAESVIPVRRFWATLKPPSVPHSDVLQAEFSVVVVGTATALLAIVGLFLRRPGSGLGRSLVVGLFLFAVGTPVTWVALRVIPGLISLGGLRRSLFLWDLGVALLGGLGLDAVLSHLRKGRGGGIRGPTGRTRAVLPALIAAACISATGTQLLTYGRKVNPPFQPREASQLFPVTPAIEAVRSAIGPGPGRARVVPVKRSTSPPQVLPGAAGVALNLPLAGGYEPVLPESVTKLTRVLNGEPEASVVATGVRGTFWPFFTSATARTDLLGRAGVAAVLGPPDMAVEPGWAPPDLAARGLRQTYGGLDGTVYEVADRPARASVVAEGLWAGSSAEALRRFVAPSFDAHRQVILQGRPRAPAGPSSSRAGGALPPRVEWRDDRPNRVELHVTSSVAGWLVLLDGWDPGWQAKIDGRATELVRANYNFRAVAVPPGSSTVTFSYRPRSVLVGAWVSALSTGVILVLVVLGLLRASRTAGGRRSVRSGSEDGPVYSGA